MLNLPELHFHWKRALKAGFILLCALGIIALAVFFTLKGFPALWLPWEPIPGERLQTTAAEGRTVLDQAGSLSALIANNTKQVEDFLNKNLSTEFCADLTLTNSSGAEVQYLLKQGCLSPYNTTSQIGMAQRVVQQGEETFLVVLRVWNS